MATAPAADSELLFLIDFSATTQPGPKPAPRSKTPQHGWVSLPQLLSRPRQAMALVTLRAVPMPPPGAITRGWAQLPCHGIHGWQCSLPAQRQHGAAVQGRRNTGPSAGREAKVETFCHYFPCEKAYLEQLCLFLGPDYQPEIANTLSMHFLKNPFLHFASAVSMAWLVRLLCKNWKQSPTNTGMGNGLELIRTWAT